MNDWAKQGGIGLELGADIFEACDLDQVYVSEENSVSFFKELIYKRMCKVNPDLKKYSLVNDQGIAIWRPPENFFSYIFKDKKSFTDVVRGGGKIPREFVNLFCFCAHSMRFNTTEPWTRGVIFKAITQHSIQSRHDVVTQDRSNQEFFNNIVNTVKDTNSRAFLVKRSISNQAPVSYTHLTLPTICSV